MAPAARNSSSEKRAAEAAPDSTTTSTPVLTSFAATSGTIATRRSPGVDSLTTASFTARGIQAIGDADHPYSRAGLERCDGRSLVPGTERRTVPIGPHALFGAGPRAQPAVSSGPGSAAPCSNDSTDSGSSSPRTRVRTSVRENTGTSGPLAKTSTSSLEIGRAKKNP